MSPVVKTQQLALRLSRRHLAFVLHGRGIDFSAARQSGAGAIARLWGLMKPWLVSVATKERAQFILIFQYISKFSPLAQVSLFSFKCILSAEHFNEQVLSIFQ